MLLGSLTVRGRSRFFVRANSRRGFKCVTQGQFGGSMLRLVVESISGFKIGVPHERLSTRLHIKDTKLSGFFDLSFPTCGMLDRLRRLLGYLRIGMITRRVDITRTANHEESKSVWIFMPKAGNASKNKAAVKCS